MANTTRTEVPAEVNNWYNRNLLDRAVAYFAHTLFGQVRDIPSNSGTDTIKFRRYGSLSANTNALSEGETPSGKQLSVTNLTATLSYYGDYVTLTDKVQYETLDPILTETAEVLGEQAGDSIDQICRDVLVAGTTVQYASTASARNQITAAMVLSRDEVKQAVRTLKGNNARKMTSMVDASTGFNTRPINAAFIGLVHPNTTYDLKDETGWTPVEEYASKEDVMPNEVGKLDEVRFVETSNAKVFEDAGSGSADVYATLIIGRDAYGVTRLSGKALMNIVKPLGSAGTADPLDQRATSGWKATFTSLILNQSWMVRVEHGVSA